MFKRILTLLNKIDYSKLDKFQRTIVYMIYSGNIRKYQEIIMKLIDQAHEIIDKIDAEIPIIFEDINI